MHTIVADENIPFLRGALEPYCQMIYMAGSEIRNSHLKKADGLIVRTRTRCDRSLLQGTGIRFIATATIGYDHIDTGYCESQGIKWFHAAGCNSSAVRQYVACSLVEVAQKFGFELEGKIIGIIGVGNVGSKVATLAGILGMKVLLNDPPRQRKEGKGDFVDIGTIQKEADIISFHVPLISNGPDRTFRMADEGFFASLGKNAVIINTSRGPVMDESALKKKMGSPGITATVLDVWDNEPLLDMRLLAMTDIGTPHIAGYSTEGKANGTASCVQQASRLFGFGIDDWYPEKLPAPAHCEIDIEPSHKSILTILHEAFVKSYDIMQDDSKLRSSPSSFESIRNHYPTRREFPAFHIKLASPHPQAQRLLTDLGFSVEC